MAESYPENSDIHSRNFSPLVGVNDPFRVPPPAEIEGDFIPCPNQPIPVDELDFTRPPLRTESSSWVFTQVIWAAKNLEPGATKTEIIRHIREDHRGQSRGRVRTFRRIRRSMNAHFPGDDYGLMLKAAHAIANKMTDPPRPDQPRSERAKREQAVITHWQEEQRRRRDQGDDNKLHVRRLGGTYPLSELLSPTSLKPRRTRQKRAAQAPVSALQSEKPMPILTQINHTTLEEGILDTRFFPLPNVDYPGGPVLYIASNHELHGPDFGRRFKLGAVLVHAFNILLLSPPGKYIATDTLFNQVAGEDFRKALTGLRSVVRWFDGIEQSTVQLKDKSETAWRLRPTANVLDLRTARMLDQAPRQIFVPLLDSQADASILPRIPRKMRHPDRAHDHGMNPVDDLTEESPLFRAFEARLRRRTPWPEHTAAEQSALLKARVENPGAD